MTGAESVDGATAVIVGAANVGPLIGGLMIAMYLPIFMLGSVI